MSDFPLTTVPDPGDDEWMLLAKIAKSGSEGGSGSSGVSSLQGTANQINVSQPEGVVVLSTPQNIGTSSSPTFAGCTLTDPLSVSSGGSGVSSLTGIVKGNGASAFSVGVAYTDFGPPREYLTASPVTGATISFSNNSNDQTFYVTPAGALLALTINLPSNATSVVNQQVRICIRQPVTTLTIAGASTILNTVTTIAGSELFCFIKVADNVWSQQMTI